MGNIFKKIGKGISNAIKGVASVGAMIPGPWQLPSQIITIGSSLLDKKKNPADQTQRYLQQSADAQMAYQKAAMEQYQQMMDRQLTTATADKQMAYDIARGQFEANQQNILPYQLASLSALQALPMLQQLLGVPAYNLPQNINQYQPPEVNYASLYADANKQLFPGKAPADTKTDSGIRVNMLPNPDGSPQNPNTIKGAMPSMTGTNTSVGLEAYAGPSYNLENSPLYEWQKQQMEEMLRGQLSASGLSGGTYAQRELARQNQALAAQERERVIGNLSSLVNLGMGGAGRTQSNFQPPQMGNISNIYGQGAQDLASFYGNMGAIQGQLGAQTAMNYMAGMNAMAKQPSGLQTALELASAYGWLGGGKKPTTIAGAENVPDFFMRKFTGPYVF